MFLFFFKLDGCSVLKFDTFQCRQTVRAKPAAYPLPHKLHNTWVSFNQYFVTSGQYTAKNTLLIYRQYLYCVYCTYCKLLLKLLLLTKLTYITFSLTAYMHACIHKYVHRYIYIHTHIHTYIHTHTHTYIHTYILTQS